MRRGTFEIVCSREGTFNFGGGALEVTEHFKSPQSTLCQEDWLTQYFYRIIRPFSSFLCFPFVKTLNHSLRRPLCAHPESSTQNAECHTFYVAELEKKK